jgi:phenylacetic acid degradation operon negative regulatory protein
MSELKLVPADTPNYTAEVLRIAAGGFILAGAVAAPNLPRLLAFVWDKKSPDKTLRAIRNARQRGWITFAEDSSGIKVALTESGKLRWQRVELQQPLSAKHWDGKWRLIIFDIPTNKRYHANEFRKHLRTLGLQPLQRSVWVTPYPCETQIAILRQLYQIRFNVRLMEALAIDDEAELKATFNVA